MAFKKNAILHTLIHTAKDISKPFFSYPPKGLITAWATLG
jgi:hypothetical protein